MGIDYENIRKFAEEEGMVLDIKVVANISDLIEKLKTGEAQVAAYPVPKIGEYSSEIMYCGPYETSWQVLVQRKDDSMVEDVTQLVDKDIFVENGSRFYYRLINLNDELGGDIKIHAIDNDTITSEDFLQMVNSGEIDYAVVDSETVALNRGLYPKIDTSLRLSFEQAASWAVAPGMDSLAMKIDSWEKSHHDSPVVREIYKRYYDREKDSLPVAGLSNFIAGRNLKNGRVSPYDDIFRKFASLAGYDWKLLSAIAYCESRFQEDVRSRYGASGLMQVMPSSASAMGENVSAIFHPEVNVRAAAKILASIDKALQDKVPDREERIKFVLAAYNSGLGHIYDSIALAKKTGLDPAKWTGNVGVAVLMKSRPEYYNDPVVKHGYFRGRETSDFVENVMAIYNYLDTIN